jgi:hypothetical protein
MPFSLICPEAEDNSGLISNQKIFTILILAAAALGCHADADSLTGM